MTGLSRRQQRRTCSSNRTTAEELDAELQRLRGRQAAIVEQLDAVRRDEPQQV